MLRFGANLSKILFINKSANLTPNVGNYVLFFFNAYYMCKFLIGAPQTIDELFIWFTENFEKTTNPHVIVFDGELWDNTHEFTRGHCIYTIYLARKSGKFAGHVAEYLLEDGKQPNLGIYASWDELICGICDIFMLKWAENVVY